MKNNQNTYKKVQEGKALFFIHEQDFQSIPSKSMQVFYNKKMDINRDITSLAINAFSILENSSLFVVDPMAASGVGAIRILKECKNVHKICINDINPLAIQMIHENLRLNDLVQNDKEIIVSNEDANLLFNELNQKAHIMTEKEESSPDVISIDPFGTPNRYLDSAFKAIKKEKGLMCITATDTAVLFGVRPLACYRKYLATPLHVEYCKEIGARILVCFSSKIANINNLGIIPLLTFYSNHFIRIFLLTVKNKKQIQASFKNYGYILHCKCNFRSIINDMLKIPILCPLCGRNDQFSLAGPLWTGDLHDTNFLTAMIKRNKETSYVNKEKINKLLTIAKDELGMPPYYNNLHKLCQKLHLSKVPKMEKVIEAIRSKGYQATRTQFDFVSFKTTMAHEDLRKMLTELI